MISIWAKKKNSQLAKCRSVFLCINDGILGETTQGGGRVGALSGPLCTDAQTKDC